MMGLIMAIHVIICILLIGIILVQAGRGGGLVESFSGVESMFGTKTNAFLTRTTTVLSILFFITCVSLAFLSLKQSRSLMRDLKPKAVSEQKAPIGTPAEQPPAEASKKEEAPAVQTQTSQVAPVQNVVEESKAGEIPKTE